MDAVIVCRWGSMVVFVAGSLPAADGCHLSGLPGDDLLAPDGTITEDGVVVGTAIGSGARVHVNRPDGSQWLFCAGGSACRMPIGPP